jgi:hypothetical protein
MDGRDARFSPVSTAAFQNDNEDLCVRRLRSASSSAFPRSCKFTWTAVETDESNY